MEHEKIFLFPLNVVLFPNMPLQLRVFEERYKRMISRCIEKRMSFGVVLIRRGQETGETAEPERIGTRATIQAYTRHEDGNYEVLAAGTERFRLLDSRLHRDGYLVGVVEPLEEKPAEPATVRLLAGEVRSLLEIYLNELVRYAGFELPGYALPESAAELSFLVAAVLQVPLSERQVLLETTHTAHRLSRERDLLERDVERLRNGMPGRRTVTARPLDRQRILAETTRN